MTRRVYFESEGEVIVINGVTVRIVTSNQVISVTGGGSASVSVVPSKGALVQALRAKMIEGMDMLNVPFCDVNFDKMMGAKPVIGMTRVRLAYEVLISRKMIIEYHGVHSDFLHEAIRRGWWKSIDGHRQPKFSDVKRHAWWTGYQWEGDADCVIVAEFFCTWLD